MKQNTNKSNLRPVIEALIGRPFTRGAPTRNFLTVLMVASVLFAGIRAACAEQPTRPQMAPVNIVTGGGQVVYPDSGWWDPGYSETYGLSVISRTDGTVKGMLQTQWEDSVLMHAQIICLKVVGNTAAMTMRITQTDNPATYPLGSLWSFRVRDGDPSGEADAISYFFRHTSASDCLTLNFDALWGGNVWFPWTNGNISIR
jgi:hypothetical protein